MIPIGQNYFGQQLSNGRCDVYTVGNSGTMQKVVHCLNVAEAFAWVNRAENTPYKLAR